MFYVYFLRSRNKSAQTYIGYSSDLKRRMKEHNAKKSGYTKIYAPWELLFYEAYKSKVDAKRRELYFKTSPGRKTLKLMLRDSLGS